MKPRRCLICRTSLPSSGRNWSRRNFCCASHRNRWHNIQNADYSREWQQRRRAELAAEPSPDKVQCLDCHGWYVQLGSHVIAAHGYETAREYREHHKLEVKRGITAPAYRRRKGRQAKRNLTYLNLKAGKRFWFHKGDRSAGRYKRSPVTIERIRRMARRRAIRA